MRIALFTQVLIALVLTVAVASCNSTHLVRTSHPSAKQFPPGQAKKVYGHQSARAFAPGQQKKQFKAPNYKGNGKGKKHKGKGKRK